MPYSRQSDNLNCTCFKSNSRDGWILDGKSPGSEICAAHLYTAPPWKTISDPTAAAECEQRGGGARPPTASRFHASCGADVSSDHRSFSMGPDCGAPAHGVVNPEPSWGRQHS